MGSLKGAVATASGFQHASSDGVAPQLSSWGSFDTPHPFGTCLQRAFFRRVASSCIQNRR